MAFADLITQAIWLHGAGAADERLPAGDQQLTHGGAGGGWRTSSQAAATHWFPPCNFLFSYELKQYLEPLGLSPADVAAVTEKLAEDLEKRAVTLGLSDSQSRQVYLQSIANANAELGRVNQDIDDAEPQTGRSGSECFDPADEVLSADGPDRDAGEIA